MRTAPLFAVTPTDVILSLLVAALFFGWTAPNVLFGVIAHELGHRWAMGLRGYWPTSINLWALGMFVTWPRPPRTRADAVFVHLAGPIAGFLATVPLLISALAPLSQQVYGWLMLGVMNIWWLQLLNLLPIPGLDGGQTCRDITHSIIRAPRLAFGVTVLLFGVGIFLLYGLRMDPVFIIIWVCLGGRALVNDYENMHADVPRPMSVLQILLYTSAYLGVAAFGAAML